MRHEESYFSAPDGLRLYYQRWLPDAGMSRAVIVMIHGDFAQSGWYMNLPIHETLRGYAIYAPDRRG
ncbi:MAG TPA: hypothetical protein VFQ25_04200 [Ktedonobacterales bacterium]|nr:hypothetical protein [Ktedonobacterales bacterium]